MNSSMEVSQLFILHGLGWALALYNALFSEHSEYYFNLRYRTHPYTDPPGISYGYQNKGLTKFDCCK